MAKVIIYTTPVCPYCQMAKEFFKENNIQYDEKDVSTDYVAVEEMIKKSGQLGVPVIDIDGQIIIGFDEEGIKQALKIN
ncbi:MAG: glutaredoxin family protein [Patescibacteria group bacterium]|nr:glutaredoxin family protein [Patescibacteria group bacterium]